MPSGFWDVTDGGKLRNISPLDILGDPTRPTPDKPKPGYASIFPSFQALWQGQVRLIGQMRDLHDVSKHRRSIFVGGKRRLDRPDGFYESLGIPEESSNREDSILRTLLSPEAEIILESDPKSPSVHRVSRPVGQRDLLENLVPSFAKLINWSGAAALADAQTNIPLKERQFRGGTIPQVRKMGG